MVELMQDEIKMTSSFITIFLQFHRNASYLVTLLCLIYNMKLRKHCSGVNLDGRLEMWCGSQVDLTWPMMVETTSCTNSVKLKLVKHLNKPCLVAKMSCTPVLGSANCPPPSSNSIGVRESFWNGTCQKRTIIENCLGLYTLNLNRHLNR
jgi:hypothetical protein